MWIFISDVHLIESDSERGNKILSFLNLVKDDIEGLGIVGDLFDFWFGYKTVTFNNFIPVISKLNEIREKGTRILYIAGNHDFHFGSLFETIIPIETHTEPLSLELGGKKIFLHHGDGIDKKDIRYNVFKSIVRSKFTLTLSELVHPNIGWRIAKALSKTSHDYFQKKEKRERYLKACIDYAKEKFEEGYDIFVFGHLHSPFVKKFDVDGRERLLINLGDWLSHYTFLRYCPTGGFELMRYDFYNNSLEEYKISDEVDDLCQSKLIL